MEILPFAYYESLKRFLISRRRRYQKVNYKRKLQVVRLGGSAASARGRLWRIRRVPKLQWKIVSPIKLLAKFHQAYVAMMISLANKMTNSNSNGGLFRGRKLAKGRHVSWVSSGEEVDSRLVVEIYKNLAASRQVSTEFL